MDYKIGTSGNDTFDGSINQFGTATLSSVDTIEGAGGIDTLIAGNVGVGTSLTATIKDVEYLRFVGAADVDFFNITGATNVEFSNGAGTARNLGATSMALAASNVTGATAVTFNYTNAALAGANEQTVTVTGVSQTAVVGGLAFGQAAGSDNTGLETLNLVSAGNNRNTIDDISTAGGAGAADTLKTLNISGAAQLVITDVLENTVTTVNAASAAGGVTVALGTVAAASGRVVSVTGGDGNDSLGAANIAADLKVDAGKGNDTVSVGAGVAATDTVAGGDGTDTLRTTAIITATQAANVSGFEALRLDEGVGNTTQALNALAGITSVVFDGDTAGVGAGNTADTVTLSNQSTQTVNIRTADAADSVTVTGLTDTSTDALTVSFNTATAAAGVDMTTNAASTLTAASYETINLSAVADTANSNNSVDLRSTAVKTVTINNASLGSFTLDNDGAAYGQLTSIDAVNSVGGVLINADANDFSVALTIAGGAGNDTVTGSTLSDSISGNAGMDTLNGGGGNDTINGGAGNDSLTGGTGNDVISGDDNDDRIIGATGNDNLTGGAGNDVFVVNVTALNTMDLTANDTIGGGDGTDAVELVFAGAFALNLDATTEGRLANVTTLEGFRINADVGADSLVLGDIALGAFTASTVTVTHVTGDADGFTLDARAILNNSARVNYTGGDGADTYIIGNGVDNLNLGDGDDFATVTNPIFLQAGDTLAGGGGTDSLTINAGTASTDSVSLSTATLANVSSFETLTANFAASTAGNLGFTLSDAFAQANRNLATNVLTIGVTEGGGTGTLTVNGSAVSASVGLTISSTTRADTITGGSGNDTVVMAASTLLLGESLTGGTGNDTLSFTGSNSLTGSTISGFEVVDFNVAGVVAITGLASVFNGQTFLFTENAATSDNVNTVTLLANGVSSIDFSKLTTTSGADFADNDQIIIDLSLASNNSLSNSYVGSGLADSVTGGGLGDTITGGAGADVLLGGAGADNINGGTGADTVTGGTGVDTIDITEAAADSAADQVRANEGDGAVAAAGTWATPDTVVGFNADIDTFRVNGVGTSVILNGAAAAQAGGTVFTAVASGAFSANGAVGGAFITGATAASLVNEANVIAAIGAVATETAGEEAYFVVTNTAGTQFGVYHFVAAVADNAVTAGELELLGVATFAGTLSAADVIFF